MASNQPHSEVQALSTSELTPGGLTPLPDASEQPDASKQPGASKQSDAFKQPDVSKQLVLAAKTPQQDESEEEVRSSLPRLDIPPGILYQVSILLTQSSQKDVYMNPDVELAMTVLDQMSEKVNGEVKKFDSCVKQPMADIRRKIELHRHLNPDPDFQETLTAINEVFDRLIEDNAERPGFIEQVRNSMQLLCDSVTHGSDNSSEMFAVQKQVHDLKMIITNQQELFKDYKVATKKSQNKRLAEAEEVAARLVMDKAGLQKELNKGVEEIEKSENLVGKLRKDLQQAETRTAETLKAKDGVDVEVRGLKETVNNLQEKLTVAEQNATGHHEAEHHRLTEEVGKEVAKVAGLEKLVNTLEKGGNALKHELKLAKAEIDATKNELKVTRGEAEALKINIADMKKSHAAKIQELSGQNMKLQGKIMETIDNGKKAAEQHAKSHRELTEKVTKLAHLYDDLEEELENNEKARTEVQAENVKLKDENGQLLSTVQELKNSGAVGNGMDPAELEKLLGELEQWKVLARKSYGEYKNTLVLYRGTENVQQVLTTKEEENAALRKHVNELQATIRTMKAEQAVQPVQANGNATAANPSAKYWKDRYESLLQAQIAHR
ncbi:hypothetical protein P154DRAFT_518447 [Amniculicola lignicola CBS 123094]|uniref:Uncharacterized protein n=1 Tax=Amniculicola lignicola CBS 123094 TaxID=1392246 RepID=A0A6A5WY88_9PLEO|nr:hypothetical protein P154DRAFT_518447 [Amniculicola lignicola CBS 123094]